MTTSNPPSKAPGKALSDAPTTAAASTKDVPSQDVLSDLPPMPKTKPVKSAPAARDTRAAQAAQAAHGSKAAAKPDTTPLMVTKKELFTRVKARTGKIKGHDVRAVMDVLLDEVGAALVNGETLKLPALGTMKVQRHKPQAKADVVVCKLNRKKPVAKVKDPLAKPPKGS